MTCLFVGNFDAKGLSGFIKTDMLNGQLAVKENMVVDEVYNLIVDKITCIL